MRRKSRTTTYRDLLGNPPLMNILSFVPTTLTTPTHIRIYKRVDASDPSQDVLVETEILPNAVQNWYPYYYVLFNAESGASYVVTYLDSDGNEVLTAANRVSAENYVPPIPNQFDVMLNPARIGAEWLRRDYLVLEQDGEKAILLRKKRSGVRCECMRSEDMKPMSRCSRCYGVGWVGGYEVFYPFLIDFQPAGERIQLTQYGLVIDTNPRGWAVIVPRIADGDFVVRLWDQKLDRFEINNPTRTGRDGVAGVPTIQEFSFKLHNSDHPIYRYPVEDHVSDYTVPTEHFGIPERV